MKQLVQIMTVLLMILGISLQARAWIESSPMEKAYTFKFHLANDSFEYSQKAPSYEEAYEKAAQACFNHFKAGRRVSEDRGLDIIDICANPRST